jgi:hypothetical protein
MRRWFNGEIAFGFVAGVLTLLFLIGVSSYQVKHCGEVSLNNYTPNTESKINTPTNFEPDLDTKKSDYDNKHPFSCGLLGLPNAFIGYVDSNEGFFVGLFTAALFIATIFLWQSTNRLWIAGERQRESSEHIASLQRESAEKIGEARVRAYISIKHTEIAFLKEFKLSPAVTFIATNSGQSPAINFIWNVTIQYLSQDNRHREGTLTDLWLQETGINVPATADATPSSAIISNMTVREFANNANIFVVRIKIDFRYADVFNKEWFGEAFYAGTAGQRLSDEGLGLWVCSKLSSMPKPRDWDDIKKADNS